MVVSTSQRKSKLTDELCVAINVVNIENVTCGKLLGVSVDDCITWNYHFSDIYRKIFCQFFQMKKWRPFLSQTSCITFFNCFINPNMDYCATIWGRFSHSNIFYLLNHCTSTFKRSFKYKGAYVWNILPDHIRSCTSLLSFKKAAKDFFYGVILCPFFHEWI